MAGNGSLAEMPYLPTSPKGQTNSNSASSADSSTPPPHLVLYAEDNAANIALMEEIVEDYGQINLVCVSRGDHVVASAQQIKPHLILLDLHLPIMNGDVILRELRALPDVASIPVVVVSANAMPSEVKRLLGESANSYLTKPFDISQLLDLFDQYLKR